MEAVPQHKVIGVGVETQRLILEVEVVVQDTLEVIEERAVLE